MRISLGTLLESGDTGPYVLEGAVDADLLRLHAVARGYQFIDLDCRPVNDKTSLMAQAVSAFALPPHFGQNWDALADCIMDLSWLEGIRWVVLVRGLERLHALDPDSYGMIVDILSEAGAYWSDQERPFVVLFTADCGPAAQTFTAVAFT